MFSFVYCLTGRCDFVKAKGPLIEVAYCSLQ